MLADGFELAPSFLDGIRLAHHTVKNVMSPGATTVIEDTSAREMARLMHSKNIKRVPVMRDGKLVGIVARSDLVRALAAKLGEKPPPIPEPINQNEALRRGREKTAP
jgi:CBS-domain-containing membrane protein